MTTGGDADATDVALRGDILVVCAANVCRSPLAQALLAAALPGTRVQSAGIDAVVGAAMCAVSASSAPGRDAVAHVARQLTPDLIRSADLVLTMEREQRSSAIRLAPGAQNRTFTLREAARLVEAMGGRSAVRLDRVSDLAKAMHDLRGTVSLPRLEVGRRRGLFGARPTSDPLTIADGHGRSDVEHRKAVRLVEETVERVTAGLRRPTEAEPEPS